MSFSQQLRQEADHIFEAIFNHPFVQGIAKGELKKEQLIHYVVGARLFIFSNLSF